jgi:hypothetical protein
MKIKFNLPLLLIILFSCVNMYGQSDENSKKD